MSSSPTPAEKRPSGQFWKRIIIRSAAFGAGLLLTVALIAYGAYWYDNHPRPARSWPDENVPSLGIKASLKTEWRDGELNYQLEISPTPPITVDAFDAALRTKSDYSFGILLRDTSGFQLCEISASSLKAAYDDRDKIESLSYFASAYGCPYSKYADVREWSLSWSGFPAITNGASRPATTPLARPTPSRGPIRRFGNGEVVPDLTLLFTCEGSTEITTLRHGDRVNILDGTKVQIRDGRVGCLSDEGEVRRDRAPSE